MFKIFRHHLSLQTVSLVLLESLVIFVAIHYIDRYFYEFIYKDTQLRDYGVATSLAYAGLLVFAMTAFGLYYGRCLIDRRRMMGRLVFSFATGAAVLGLVVAAGPAFGFENAPILHPTTAATVGFALLSVIVVRLTVMHVANLPSLRRRVLVVGDGPQARRIVSTAQDNPRFPFEPLMTPRVAGEATIGFGPQRNLQAVDLTRLARDLRVHEVVIAGDGAGPLTEEALLNCRLQGVPVSDFLTFWERVTGRIDIDELKPRWLILCDGFALGPIAAFLKRGFDVVFSLAFLILTAPLILTTAIAVKLDSPGPVFYRQKRVGMNGRVFEALKFRSMKVDAEQPGRPQWAAAKDSRVTRVGAFIRKTRIDEIPQAINVVRGDMSFVGPRPERPEFVAQLREQIPYYDLRHRIRPGITGWAQVNYPYGASVEDAKAKLSFDLYYLKNYSLFLDVLILIETVRVVVTSDGAR